MTQPASWAARTAPCTAFAFDATTIDSQAGIIAAGGVGRASAGSSAAGMSLGDSGFVDHAPHRIGAQGSTVHGPEPMVDRSSSATSDMNHAVVTAGVTREGEPTGAPARHPLADGVDGSDLDPGTQQQAEQGGDISHRKPWQRPRDEGTCPAGYRDVHGGSCRNLGDEVVNGLRSVAGRLAGYWMVAHEHA